MGKITYIDKVATDIKADVPEINKTTAGNLNEIKSEHNTNDDRIGNIEQNQVDGVVRYNTVADLPATGVYTSSYLVTDDSTPANNGYYKWNGASFEPTEYQPISTKTDTVTQGSTEVVESGAVDSNNKSKEFKSYPLYNDFSNLTENPYTIISSASITWSENVSEFDFGKYFLDVVRLNTESGDTLKFDNFEDYLKVGDKGAVRLTYKSDNPQKFTLYLRNGGSNLATYPVTLDATSIEKTIDIKFTVDNAIDNIWLLSNSFGGFDVNYKIGSINLIKEGDGVIIKGTEITETIVDTESLIEWTTFIVGNVGQDFNSVRAAERHLETLEHSATKRYIIQCQELTIIDHDIQGVYAAKAGYPVILRGAGIGKTIIYSDGNSTAISDSDYSFPAYANTAYNLIPSIYKHLGYIHTNYIIEDCTLSATDCKYTIHQDKDGGLDFDSIIRGNHMILTKTSSAPVNLQVAGLGARQNQTMRYYDNTMELILTGAPFDSGFGVADGYGIGWHNIVAPSSRNGACYLYVEGNRMINCGIARIADENSGFQDVVSFKNNSTSLKNQGFRLQSLGNGHDILLVSVSNDVNYMDTDSNSQSSGETFLSIGDYHTKINNNTGATLQRGYCVKIVPSTTTVYGYDVELAVDNDFDFVVWQDILDGESGYGVFKGKTAPIRIVGGSWSIGTYAAINTDGRVFITPNKVDAIGVCQNPKTFTDYVKIRTFSDF